MRTRFLSVLALSGALIGACALPAGATTGPTPLAFKPRYTVSKAEAAPYLGKFKLTQPLGKQLISGAYVAGYNEFGYVEGSIVVYAYAENGQETSWLGRTYEYHAVDGGMTIDVISPENQVIFARMKLRPAGHGGLTGTLLQLVPPGPAQRVSMEPLAASSEPAESESSGSTGAGSEAPAVEAGAYGIFSTAVEAALTLVEVSSD